MQAYAHTLSQLTMPHTLAYTHTSTHACTHRWPIYSSSLAMYRTRGGMPFIAGEILFVDRKASSVKSGVRRSPCRREVRPRGPRRIHLTISDNTCGMKISRGRPKSICYNCYMLIRNFNLVFRHNFLDDANCFLWS